jgi:hypothetical protein
MTQVNGFAFYQSGDRIVLTGKAGYAWSDAWASRVSASYSHVEPDLAFFLGPTLRFGREPFNSNGDVYRVAFDTTYSKGNFSVGPTVSFLYRAANAYPTTAPEFTPERRGVSAGMTGSYAISNEVTLNARVEHLWVNEGNNPSDVSPFGVTIPGSGIPPIATRGWNVSLGGLFRF